MRTILLLTSLILSVFTLLPCLATAEQIPLSRREREWLADNPQIVVAPGPAHQPIEYIDAEGQYRGIAADYLQLLEKRLGVQFKILQPQSQEQVLDWSQKRQTDIVTSVAQTPERSAYLLFTEPYLQFPAVIITRSQVAKSLTLEQLTGLRVGVISGDAVREYMNREAPALNLYFVPDASAGLKKVSLGILDVFVGDLPAVSHHLDQETLSNLQVAGQLDFEYRLPFASRSDWPLFHQILKKGLASIQPVEREAIYHRWIPLEPESFLLTEKFVLSLFGILIVVVSVLAGIAGWNRSLKRLVQLKNNELQSTQEDYREIFENAVEGMFRSNSEGTFIRANSAMASLLGYGSPEELCLEPELARRLYVDPAERERLWHCVSNDGIVTDYVGELYRKDGRRIWVTSNVRGVKSDAGELLYLEGFVGDITARKEAEQALLEQEQIFRVVFDQAFQFMGFLKPDGTVVAVNQASLDFIEVHPDEVIGKPFWLTAWWSHSEEQQSRLQEAVNKAAAGEFVRFETSHPGKDGQIHYIDFSLKPVMDEAGEVFLLVPEGRDITARKRTEEALRNIQGELELRVAERTAELQLANQQLITEIENRKNIEQKLRDTNRELDAFVRTVSHDLRNPTTAIIAAVRHLEEEWRGRINTKDLAFVAEVGAEGERMLALLEELLEFAKAGGEATRPEQPVAVTEVVEQVVATLAKQLVNADIRVDYAALPEVYISRNLLLQIFDNLVSNALRYSSGPGKSVEVKAERQRDYVRFSVSDHGVGIPETERDKVFNIFYRGVTARKSKGTGIGLATVQKLARAHGGRAWIEETPGGGATVVVEMLDLAPSRSA